MTSPSGGQEASALARLFVAVAIADAARHALVARLEGAVDELPAARWVTPERWHLTLCFLGEVARIRCADIGGTVAEVASEAPGVTVQLAGGGTFPPARPARVAWVGVRGGEALVPLAEALRRALAKDAAELARERRPFRPHLTVARPRAPWPRQAAARFGERLAGPIGPPFAVAEALLMESRLRPTGPAYEVLRRAPLGAVA